MFQWARYDVLIFPIAWKIYFVSNWMAFKTWWQIAQNHGITEWLELERTSRSYLEQPSCSSRNALSWLFPASISLLFVSAFGQELLVHPLCPPGNFARLHIGWNETLLSLEQVTFEYELAFFPTRALSHTTLLSRSLEMSNFVLLKPGIESFVFTPFLALRNLNPTILLQPRLPLIFTFPAIPSLLAYMRSVMINSPCWLFYHLEMINCALQEPPGLLMPVVFSLQQIISLLFL